MKNRVNAVLAATLMICLAPLASQAVEPYSQDFELMRAEREVIVPGER